MSLDFGILVGRSRRVQALQVMAHLVATAGLALASAYLWISGARLGALIALTAGVGAVVASWSHSSRAHPRGILRIDTRGQAFWQAAARAGGAASSGANDAPPSSVPEAGRELQPIRWFSFAGMTWLDARVAGTRLSLLAGRDTASDADWTRLMRWLRWLDRGGEGGGGHSNT